MARLLRLLPDSASPHKPRSVDLSKIAFVSLAAMANQAKPLRGVTPSRRSKVPGGGRSWFANRALAHVRTPVFVDFAGDTIDVVDPSTLPGMVCSASASASRSHGSGKRNFAGRDWRAIAGAERGRTAGIRFADRDTPR